MSSLRTFNLSMHDLSIAALRGEAEQRDGVWHLSGVAAQRLARIEPPNRDIQDRVDAEARRAVPGPTKLSDYELLVCEELGLEPKDYLATKREMLDEERMADEGCADRGPGIVDARGVTEAEFDAELVRVADELGLDIADVRATYAEMRGDR